MNFPLLHKHIWVAGETGMVGQAVVRRLMKEVPDCTLLSAPHAVLDLCDQNQTSAWIAANRPDAIVLAAATVGGIGANSTRPADFLYDNLMIAANVIHAAAALKVSKLLYLGSSCIYPRMTQQPIDEDALLSGPLEPTNEAYAIAKIAGIKLCQAYRKQHGCDFISAMPCNLYGPGDTYDVNASHVIPALILKIGKAMEEGRDYVTLWGTGTPLREFLHVDDLAASLVHLLRDYSDAPPVNVGSGEETSIADLAAMIADHIGYRGKIIFDPTMPDGTPRKVLDSSRMRAMGWAPGITLNDGLRDTVRAFVNSTESGLKDAA